jgi:hypothetical protein
MVPEMTSLDAHEQPSEELRAIWKEFSKTDQASLINGGRIDDFAEAAENEEFCRVGSISATKLTQAFKEYLSQGSGNSINVEKDAPIYLHPLLPGK